VKLEGTLGELNSRHAVKVSKQVSRACRRWVK